MISGGKNSKARMKTKNKLVKKKYRKIFNKLCFYKKRVIDRLNKIKILKNEL